MGFIIFILVEVGRSMAPEPINYGHTGNLQAPCCLNLLIYVN